LYGDVIGRWVKGVGVLDVCVRGRWAGQRPVRKPRGCLWVCSSPGNIVVSWVIFFYLVERGAVQSDRQAGRQAGS